MGRIIEVNEPVLLALQLFDGDTTRGVRARVYNDAGTEQSGSPFNLTHSARGIYRNNSGWTPTTQGEFIVNYEVFTDGTYTTLDKKYEIVGEIAIVRSSLKHIRDATAQAGASTTITLDASASATNDFYKNTSIQIVSGTGANQTRVITAYNGTTKVATVDEAWATNPDNTSKFTINGRISFALIDGSITSSKFATDAITAAVLASDASDEIAAKILVTPANKLTTNASGHVTLADSSITAAKFATDSITAAALASDASDEIAAKILVTPANKLTTDASGRVTLTPTEHTQISSDVWGVSRSSYTAAGTFGLSNQIVRDGTAQAGASTTITLDAGANSNNDFYNHALITIVSGLGIGQSRFITAYDGTTKVATVDRAWTTNPDNTSIFIIEGDSNSAYRLLTNPTQKLLTDASGFVTLTDGSITAAKFAIDSITASALASDTSDEIASKILVTPANKLTTDVAGKVELTSAEHTQISGDVWNASRSSYLTSDSFGRSNQVLRDGTAQAGASTTITLDAGASSSDDFYNNSIIQIISGLGVGQSRFISDYVGSSKVATVDNAWVTTPDNTSVFVIRPISSVAYQILENPTQKLETDASGFVIISDGTITSAKFATDAIDSNALASNAVSEIVTAIFGNTVDTKTFAEIQEILLAYATGKIERSGSDYVYKKQDNTTTLFTLTSSPTDRTRS